VKRIEDGLPTLDLPTLLMWARPGALVSSEKRVSWFRERLPKLEVVDLGEGIHYLQEDHPDEIGRALVEWLGRGSR